MCATARHAQGSFIVKMHVLSGGLLRMRRHVYVPDAQRDETIDLPVSAFLLRHAQGNVLFDTGCHPQALADAPSRWGTMAKALQPIGDANDHVLTGLTQLGLAAQDIDVVINSHFHTDHCGCNEFFKNATLICHEKELLAAQGEDALAQGYLPSDWDHPMPTQTIDREWDVFGDRKLCLIPLPGHTPGTLGAMVTTATSGAFLLVADALALQHNYEREAMPKNTWDKDLALHSLREVKKIEQAGAKVIFGHDLQQWQSLRKGAHAYE